MSDLPLPDANFRDAVTLQGAEGVRLHVDQAVCRAANWVEIRGWVADLPCADASLVANAESAYVTLSARPDVCAALALAPERASGFAIQLLDGSPLGGRELGVDLFLAGTRAGRFEVRVPAVALPMLRVPTRRAIELTRALYRGASDGKRLDEASDVGVLATGALVVAGCEPGFDNTRIGNYHPEVAALLSRPGVVGLDIGCGIRDTVFDNLVTQDVFPSPTATLVTPAGAERMPFDAGVFDLVILDSVLEHVPRPLKLLEEVRRLLKPGGVLVGDVPFLQPLHLLPHHYFNYTPHGLAVLAEDARLTLRYAAAEDHQRPEFSLEWLLRRTFESLPPAEAESLRALTLGDFLRRLSNDKKLIAYPADALAELAAGFHFRMTKDEEFPRS